MTKPRHTHERNEEIERNNSEQQRHEHVRQGERRNVGDVTFANIDQVDDEQCRILSCTSQIAF